MSVDQFNGKVGTKLTALKPKWFLINMKIYDIWYQNLNNLENQTRSCLFTKVQYIGTYNIYNNLLWITPIYNLINTKNKWSFNNFSSNSTFSS